MVTWPEASSNNISYNAIHDIGMYTLSDMGCVVSAADVLQPCSAISSSSPPVLLHAGTQYTLGIQPGTEVVNNFCHSGNASGSLAFSRPSS